jgi:hypothetical protein
MTTQLLIDAIVRQTTILIAQLATKQGSRTPLADIAEQVFGELAQELHRQGVSRKVAADMFGMALRTYKRRVQRLGESETVAGRSLWEAVHDFLHQRPVATQEEVLTHFHRDDEQIVRGVLADLVDSGLVFRAGRGGGSTYRAATGADLDHARTAPRDPDGMDTLVWAVVYRFGPIERSGLGGHVGLPASDLDASLARLVDSKNIVRTELNGADGYAAHGFVVSLDQSNGWEGAVFDHFQAVVTTICRKLAADAATPTAVDHVGGSTFTLEVWPGHPLEGEVLGELGRFRKRLGDLRGRVLEHNRAHAIPQHRSKVVIYGGQSVVDHDDQEDSDGF